MDAGDDYFEKSLALAFETVDLMQSRYTFQWLCLVK